MASLIAKWQKCGKSSCRCSNGVLHGPYFWLVKYISKKAVHKRRGKYSWQYLGKNPRDVWERLEILDKRFNERYSILDLNKKLKILTEPIERDESFKIVEPILTIKDDSIDR
ncbi:MAG: DUF6788 family protein [Candidatus Hodarchaeales archaeon]